MQNIILQNIDSLTHRSFKQKKHIVHDIIVNKKKTNGYDYITAQVSMTYITVLNT